MGPGAAVPAGAAVAIDDFLDSCAGIKAGQDVVLAAHLDGVYGGDNLVDPAALAWLQAAIERRGATASILWIDELQRAHQWRVPPVFMAALESCDVFINHSFDLTIEELKPIMTTAMEHGTTLCRNFATTPGLLSSPWAMTPHELVTEIRYQACVPFEKGGMAYEITDDEGTHVTGVIAPPSHRVFTSYAGRRNDMPGYRPFPEWVFPPINVRESSGTIVFDRMLSWWSRYIGVPPVFRRPIRLCVENDRIVKIEGGGEANALRQFLDFLRPRLGEQVYDFTEIHSGVHPHAVVSREQCSHPLIRRIVEHSDACNIHVHIGGRKATADYPYSPHITGDIRTATWRVGGQLVHDRGRLTALDHPHVRAVCAKYPGRPGIGREDAGGEGVRTAG